MARLDACPWPTAPQPSRITRPFRIVCGRAAFAGRPAVVDNNQMRALEPGGAVQALDDYQLAGQACGFRHAHRATDTSGRKAGAAGQKPTRASPGL